MIIEEKLMKANERYITLVEHASSLFEDNTDQAMTWILTELLAYDNKPPIMCIISDNELNIMLDIIGRLEYGVIT